MARATNLKNYYSIQADNRNLNYENYFVYGQKNISEIDDYTSHNTYQMQLDEVIDVLKGLDFVKR